MMSAKNSIKDDHHQDHRVEANNCLDIENIFLLDCAGGNGERSEAESNGSHSPVDQVSPSVSSCQGSIDA